MSRNLNDLEKDFKVKVEDLIGKCAEKGVIMKPFYTKRSVFTQAKLYRQSRSFAEIKQASDFLKDNGAVWLSKVLLDVGAQNGRWATNALPGFSMHQHGLAVDCFWELDGKAEWTVNEDSKNGYYIYAKTAKMLGLEAGFFWRRKDAVHVQKDKYSINQQIRNGSLTYVDLDRKMREMYD